MAVADFVVAFILNSLVADVAEQLLALWINAEKHVVLFPLLVDLFALWTSRTERDINVGVAFHAQMLGNQVERD